MLAKPYPEAKRRILLERNVEDFVTFLEEVTDNQGRTFIRNGLLPRTVTGFRPGHAPLTLTVPKLISNLREEQELTNPDSRKWDMFSDAWKAWIVSHSRLNEILLQFDNRDDFDENQQCIIPANSELDRHCFEVLVAASHSDRINQETIRRFYEYGYFNQCEQIENLINGANTREVIERRQQIEQLPDQVNRLRQEINDLRTQFSGLEPISELQHVLEQRISEVERSFEEQISGLPLTQSFSQLTQSVESLNSRLDVLENSQTEIESGINDFVEHIERIIRELEQQIQDTNQSVTEQLDQSNNAVRDITAQNEQQRQSIEQSVTERFSSLVSAIAEIRSDVELQNQRIDTSENDSHTLETEKSEGTIPRTAQKAIEFGKYYAAKLEESRERYQNENEYLVHFQDSLRRYGITESNETAPAFHVALKAFPALEIADTRIFKIWNVTCNKHFFYTRLFVEMGWLGIQDWFPKLLADECFGERLERIDLKASIQKMLGMGNMFWAIHFRNCDRSFPECYLPSFIRWIKSIPESHISKFFLPVLQEIIVVR